jgi:hypothetical protein
MIDRRTLLKALGMAPIMAPMMLQGEENLPPVRALTHGPKFHWFGYYDKLEFDPGSRYVLGMEVGFEHRTPAPEDEIRLGMIDLKSGDKWIDLASSRAWSWQQGCMLQWLPGSKTEVIYNDRDNDRFVSYILDTKSRRRKALPAPIYGISPDARWAVHPDFRRLHDTRPGYGYNGIPDPNQNVDAPDDAGIWRLDMVTGKHDLIIPLSKVAAIPDKHDDLSGAKHWFNHLLVAPDAKRFIFLHRWQKPGRNGFLTRMFTSNPDGTDLYIVDPYGQTSHFIWRDPKHILAWASHPSHGTKFYLYEDRTEKVEAIGPDVMVVNGHCTYLPDKRWILNDTYPDPARKQNPYLYDTSNGKRYPLGHFESPVEYVGEFRCDTHPRFSPDGRKVVIDSAHGGDGRQLYLIDISAIVA